MKDPKQGKLSALMLLSASFSLLHEAEAAQPSPDQLRRWDTDQHSPWDKSHLQQAQEANLFLKREDKARLFAQHV